MSTMLIVFFLPILFALVAITIYSFYFGTSWLGVSISGITGGAIGGLANSISEVGYVFSAGLSNFLQPDYWGMSLFAIGIIFWIAVLVFNLIATIDENPELIR